METMELSAVDVWTMVTAALVLLMTPGLAFFYGGMTRAKAALNMIMMSFVSIAIVGIVWVLWGFNMTGAEDGGLGFGGIFANPFSDFGLRGMMSDPSAMIGVGFGATFAIISVALISGAVADRAKFSTWCVFVPLWTTLVYCPLAFMVWGGGLMGPDGAIGSIFGEAVDYAGGLVVHISAGVSALVLALLMGKRQGFGTDPGHRPHNLPFVLLGAGILWFGWFGFNGGAATDAAEAGQIWVNTLVAPGAAMLGWIIVEIIRIGRPTALGSASGLVAGLVAITPACAFVEPLGAIAIGLIAGVLAGAAVQLKYKLGFDDSLDVVGVHLVAGIVGTVMIGFFGVMQEDGRGGLFYGGDFRLLAAEVLSVIVAVAFAAVMTTIVGLALKYTMGLRVSTQDEIRGVDYSEHRESAYTLFSESTETTVIGDDEGQSTIAGYEQGDKQPVS